MKSSCSAVRTSLVQSCYIIDYNNGQFIILAFRRVFVNAPFMATMYPQWALLSTDSEGGIISRKCRLARKQLGLRAVQLSHCWLNCTGFWGMLHSLTVHLEKKLLLKLIKHSAFEKYGMWCSLTLKEVELYLRHMCWFVMVGTSTLHFHVLDIEQNKLLLVAFGHMAFLMLLGQWKLRRNPDVLPSVWKYGYARIEIS